MNCGICLQPVCPNCGSAVETAQNFCGVCGADLRGQQTGTSVSPASYTPDHLAERILSERHLIVGERKWVTVLFVDLVGSTHAIDGWDPEEADRFLSEAVAGMMEAVHLYEGTVNTVRGDGIMALFGAPIAHEDHAVRAALTALAIPESVAAATQGRAETRVGMHSGEVLVREVGNDLSIEYQPQGPTVHIAARMESLADPGKALITEAVHRLIEGRVETRRIGPTRLKGISEPVVAYELTRALASSPWQARAARGLAKFTGRQREVEVLRTAANDVRSGRGRTVLITGEAGIGKSRLLHELLSGDGLAGFRILRADTSPFEMNSPYYAVKELIAYWLEERALQPLKDLLQAHFQSSDPGLLPAIPALTALFGEEAPDPEWEALAPEQRKRRTRDAIRALFHHLADNAPLALVIEDLHWADGETQAILDDLVAVASTVSMLLVLTNRPEFENPWTGRIQVKQLQLEPLSREFCDSLLDELLGGDPSVQMFKSGLAARVGGIPFFLEESVRALVESGALEGSKGHYVASEAKDIPRDVPNTVQAVLAARIDRLEPRDKNLLQVASVAGTEVQVELLRRVAIFSEEDMLAILTRLQNRDFLYEYQVLPAQEFRFVHALVREVAYRSLPKKQRRTLHAQMVGILEADGMHPSSERLAYHAVRGELWDKAVHYSLKAADKSIDQSAYRDASAFLRDAAKSLDRMPQSRDVTEASIDVRMRMRVAETGAPGGLARLVRELQTADRQAESIGDRRRRARILIHRGYVANMLGHVREADVCARLTLELAHQIGDRYMQVESRIVSAQNANYSGRPRQVAALLTPHIDYLIRDIRHETMGMTMIRAVVACAHLAIAGSAAGDFEAGRRWVDEGTAIAVEAGRPFDQMYMEFTRGVCLDFEGEREQSVLAHERSAAIADQSDIWFMKTFAQPWRGHALLMAGRTDEARAVLNGALEAARRAELPLVEAQCRGFASMVARAMGDSENAQSDAEAALAYGRRRSAPLLELLGLRGLGSDEAAANLAERCGFQVWADALRLRNHTVNAGPNTAGSA